MSQTGFADLGGVQKRAQINYEKGERSPDAAYLSAVAGHGVDVTYVLTGVRMDEATRSHLTRAIQFSVQLGDPVLTGLSIEAAKAQAQAQTDELQRRAVLMKKLEKLSEADVTLLLQMADRIAKP